ncbi:MAG: hypothetical protein K2K07_14455 [Lachnospiraceae bacterium]|nr:hypothetical protein [Lachnospiraceae bacterium]
MFQKNERGTAPLEPAVCCTSGCLRCADGVRAAVHRR